MAKKKPDFTGKVVLMVNIVVSARTYSGAYMRRLLLDAQGLNTAFAILANLKRRVRSRRITIVTTFHEPKRTVDDVLVLSELADTIIKMKGA